MESAATEDGHEEEDEGAGFAEWAMLGVGAAPWLYVGAVLAYARNPETSPLGFSGYVSNPTWAQSGGGTGLGGGGSAANAAIDCEPNILYIAPLPPPNTTTIVGILFIPYEYVDFLDVTPDPFVGTVNLGTAQADLNGALSIQYTPKVSGNHTIVAVDLDTGVRVSAPLFVKELAPPQ